MILFCVEILYKEGNKILEAKKQYCRYYSKKFYQKAENIKKYIDETLKKKMGFELNAKLKKIEKNYGDKIAEIDSFVSSIKNLAEEKNTPFLPNKTGFTNLNEILQGALGNKLETENIYFIIDILQDMADSLKKGLPSETEAYCLANIIKINFSLFKNYDFKLYEELNSRINFICEKLELEDDNKPNWLKQLSEINIEIKNKEIQIKEEILKNNQKNINEIEKIFNNKINENNKPIEFLYYIIDRYPFSNCDNSEKNSLNQKNFEEIFNKIFPLYHPDNYRNRDDYSTYHKIYSLLVEIEKKFLPNNH